MNHRIQPTAHDSQPVTANHRIQPATADQDSQPATTDQEIWSEA